MTKLNIELVFGVVQWSPRATPRILETFNLFAQIVKKKTPKKHDLHQVFVVVYFWPKAGDPLQSASNL